MRKETIPVPVYQDAIPRATTIRTKIPFQQHPPTHPSECQCLEDCIQFVILCSCIILFKIVEVEIIICPCPWSPMSRHPRVDTCRVMSFFVRYFVTTSAKLVPPLTSLILARPGRQTSCIHKSGPPKCLTFLPLPRREQKPRLTDESVCNSGESPLCPIFFMILLTATASTKPQTHACDSTSPDGRLTEPRGQHQCFSLTPSKERSRPDGLFVVPTSPLQSPTQQSSQITSGSVRHMTSWMHECGPRKYFPSLCSSFVSFAACLSMFFEADVTASIAHVLCHSSAFTVLRVVPVWKVSSS